MSTLHSEARSSFEHILSAIYVVKYLILDCKTSAIRRGTGLDSREDGTSQFERRSEDELTSTNFPTYRTRFTTLSAIICLFDSLKTARRSRRELFLRENHRDDPRMRQVTVAGLGLRGWRCMTTFRGSKLEGSRFTVSMTCPITRDADGGSWVSSI